MIEKEEIGFVLRSHLPARYKLSIYCVDKGKIELTVKNFAQCSKICPGMVVTFFCSHCQGKGFFSDGIKILDPRLSQSYEDIMWMHHVLETFYYFVPMEYPSVELFNYLVSCAGLLENQFIFGQNIENVKKVFILRFFIISGLFPGGEKIKFDQFESLKFLDIDFENEQKVKFLSELAAKFNETHQKELNRWIVGCFKRHPCFGEFKTLKFCSY